MPPMGSDFPGLPKYRPAPVEIWLWDGMREYKGTATALTREAVTAFLKLSRTGDATVIPTQVLVQGLIQQLKNKVVELKIMCQGMEAAVRARITSLKPDAANPRRLDLEAKFESPSERNQMILAQLSAKFPPPAPPKP